MRTTGAGLTSRQSPSRKVSSMSTTGEVSHWLIGMIVDIDHYWTLIGRHTTFPYLNGRFGRVCKRSKLLACFVAAKNQIDPHDKGPKECRCCHRCHRSDAKDALDYDARLMGTQKCGHNLAGSRHRFPFMCPLASLHKATTQQCYKLRS